MTISRMRRGRFATRTRTRFKVLSLLYWLMLERMRKMTKIRKSTAKISKVYYSDGPGNHN